MHSKEIVKRAIRFEKPPRLPVLMGTLGISDVSGLWVRQTVGFSSETKGLDKWGCTWARTGVENMGQVVGHPIEEIKNLDKLKAPDYTDDSFYAGAEEAIEKAEEKEKYISCGIFMVLFERMHALLGFENTLVDLYADRPAMEELALKIVDVHVTLVKEVTRRFPGRVHGWTMTDDWGTQNAAFISLDLWIDFFLPKYKRIFDAMHEAGCDVWVHSCGKVNELIEGFIKAGADVMNLQQPRALGIEEVGNRYREKISFESLADIQATLPTGDLKRIEADVEALMTHWACAKGGFIFSDYGDDRALGIADPAIKQFMYQAFSRCSEKLYGEPLPPLPGGLQD